jgi:3-oxoacyl-(acyl-carrier-protein) synthase
LASLPDWIGVFVLRVMGLVRQDERKMARFAQYAMAASEEALEDAGWKPTVFEDREATVRDG